jgi:hypothetical protein
MSTKPFKGVIGIDVNTRCPELEKLSAAAVAVDFSSNHPTAQLVAHEF